MGTDGQGQPPRRIQRAAAACYRCRQRKVRCDASIYEYCTNCQLDGVEDCLIRPNESTRYRDLSRRQSTNGANKHFPSRTDEHQHLQQQLPSPDTQIANTQAHHSLLDPSRLLSMSMDDVHALAYHKAQDIPKEAPKKWPRKAAAACYYCRRRKIRCDASIRGYPCTNCRLDGETECVLRPNESARYKNLSRNLPLLYVDNYSAIHTEKHPLPAVTLASPPSIPPVQGSFPSPDKSLKAPIQGGTAPIMPDIRIPQPSTVLSGHNFLDFDPLASLSIADVQILAANGCLYVPPRPHIDEFVQQYFSRMHPNMPVLDEAHFWRMYSRPDQVYGLHTYSWRMSLFVFQALLFASCPYVSLETLLECGFGDKREARKTLYKRAKLLYDVGFERHTLARSQGAMLLTCHTPAEDPQASTNWLLCAMENAAAISTDSIESTGHINESLKRRLQWSIFVRERILCLGRRCPQILSINIDDLQYLTEDDFSDEIMNSYVYSPQTKRLHLKILQAQCRLALILTQVVTIAFSKSNGCASDEEFHNMITRINMIKRAISTWKTDSCLTSLLTEPQADEYVSVLTNLTLMYSESARIVLSHHEALLVENHIELIHATGGATLQKIARDLGDAVDKITQIMSYFGSKDSTECIPLGVGLPMILSAINVKLSSSYSEMEERRQSLHCFAQIISQSRKAYDVTDFFSDGTNHILRLAYAITKEIFIPRASHTYNSLVCWPMGGVEGSHRAGSLTQIGGRRVTNWTEGFLKHPRAYLRISTSIDYSLANGCLPREDRLPQVVQQVTSLIVQTTKLPLMITNHRDDMADMMTDEETEDRHGDVGPFRVHDAPIPSISYAETRSYHLSLSPRVPNSDNRPTEDVNWTDGESTGRNWHDKIYDSGHDICTDEISYHRNEGRINLDYFDLEAGPGVNNAMD